MDLRIGVELGEVGSLELAGRARPEQFIREAPPRAQQPEGARFRGSGTPLGSAPHESSSSSAFASFKSAVSKPSVNQP
jgi:hypothetical protein